MYSTLYAFIVGDISVLHLPFFLIFWISKLWVLILNGGKKNKRRLTGPFHVTSGILIWHRSRRSRCYYSNLQWLWSVLVSQWAMTVSQHTKCQDPETEVATLNSAIIGFIYTCDFPTVTGEKDSMWFLRCFTQLILIFLTDWTSSQDYMAVKNNTLS